ncbi:MAG: hypothetical protein CR981_03905 [Proteobacteria bacterium]|nr:MAG: hypothetical protein CR981_03905 [Pseudomonadota bacterium]
MIRITETLFLPDNEVEITQIRASGPGGQKVNKVSSAVHLRFDINKSSLPAFSKQRLLRSRDRRLTADGCLVIKARQYRSFEKNREDARNRLAALIASSLKQEKRRKPTRPTMASRRKRIETKQRLSSKKTMRKKINGPRSGD